MSIPLETPLDQIKGIGPKFIVRLKNLEIETVKDLLWHFPNRYEDFSKIYPISELTAHQEATVSGTVQSINVRRSWRRRFVLTEAVISDYSGSIRAVWFNQPYLRNILQPGRQFNFSGKVVNSNNDLCLSNPIYEFIDSASFTETKHTARLVPIYPETRGLTSKTLRYLIKPLLEQIIEPAETLPPEILKKQKFPPISKALNDIHFPDNLNAALEAKRRFAFESLFLWQLVVLRQKFLLARQKATAIKYDLAEIKRSLQHLPFELTASQKKSLWEIIQDIAKSRPMNRLLQGDVGSGKTIIAALAAIATANNGKQVAFMAPTEILARQHFQTMTKFFPEFEKGIALLTGQEAKIFYGQGLETKAKKNELAKDIADGKIKIIVGTHALIQKNISFPELALVIVDEQHRFGVEQRKALLASSKKQKNTSRLPHFLSMSATPIPRTLSLTLFGDLDLSLITELPKDRKPIITKIISPADRGQAYQFIREQIQSGRQAFVICPRIQPSEENGKMTTDFFRKMEMKNVAEEYEKLKKEVFPDLKIAKIHGRLPAKDKGEIMRSFKEKESELLVATSVIEVGIDVPNATIMMIEGADRFGLAQLYQFRGRVGRGEHQSYCFLFSDSDTKTVQQRLQSIAEAKNGFELAEKDLQIRGPGEFLGDSQTGLPDLAMKALQNPEMVKTAREAALKVIEKDYTLKNQPILKKQAEKFGRAIHQE